MDSTIEVGFDNPKHSDCTLVLKSDGTIHKTIHVSNAVLSTHSPYFVALFTNNMKETHQREIEIELSSYEAELFYSIIRLLYSGNLVLPSLSDLYFGAKKHGVGSDENGQSESLESKSPDEAENENKQREEEEGASWSEDAMNKAQICADIIKLLDRFEIQKRVSHCLELMREGTLLIKSACFCLFAIGDLHDHIPEVKQYKQTLVNFLVNEYRNFDKLWNRDDFLQLPFGVVKGIFQSHDLLVSCEETVLQALRKWVNHNPNERVYYLAELLPLVRFFQIELNFLTDYVLDYDFFELGDFREPFALLQTYLFATIQFNDLGSFTDTFPKNWLVRRAGYKLKEVSETIEWEYDLSDLTSQFSKSFYFSGVYYNFSFEPRDKKHCLAIRPDRFATCGVRAPRTSATVFGGKIG
eukprot:TRINITY_DN8574_c0_g1_i1.p1 TRINITY_DN8574_c0_g1~~TRINITY_DN8574_c0_g1_i1.p1  ORF type:complete len:412 (-),score=67.80 TRINITY_DN8574_c0_g1_i1:63-1298(-)